MTYHRLAYDDAATTTEMASDAREAGRALQIPEQPGPASSAYVIDDIDSAGLSLDPTPSTVVVSDELADLAAGLELHFD